jgi:predicted NUDIX family phosphoesterase
MKEQVLCFPAYLLEGREFHGVFKGETRQDFYRYIDSILDSGLLQFRDRDEVETDPNWKQLIPYCVLRNKGQVFAYQRSKKSNDERLHGLWSIGVGGHINPGPGMDNMSYSNIYLASFKRELDEEVRLTGSYHDSMLGLLYDSNSEVGTVHFGVVHRVTVDNKVSVLVSDPALLNGEWKDVVWLLRNKDQFENWSRFIIEELL